MKGSLRVGFHVEGWDYLILAAFLARLLEYDEATISPDLVERDDRGDTSITPLVRKALHQFYNNCDCCVVVGMDNDGNRDLTRTGDAEDPKRPRHANHLGRRNGKCRFCQLEDAVARARPELNWLAAKPGATWPVLIAVPVEMIETWLLTCRAIVGHGDGGLFQAERLPRSVLKRRFYGKPVATKKDVETIALGLVRSMSMDQFGALATYSKSFGLFRNQVAAQRDAILAPHDCWSPDHLNRANESALD